MDVKYLKEILQYIPESAIVYSCADHGQQSEQVNTVSVTDCDDLKYYGEHIDWIAISIDELKSGIISRYLEEDEESEQEDWKYNKFTVEKITAIVIG